MVDFAAIMAQQRQAQDTGLRAQVTTAMLDQVAKDRLASAAALAAREPDGSHFSSSQHKTAHLCWRKWWFEKVAKLRDSTIKIYHATGKATHAVAERYHLKQATTWDGLFPPGWDAGLDDANRSFIRYAATQSVEKGIWQATPDVEIEAPACALVGKDFRDARGMPWLARPVVNLDQKGERVQGRPTTLITGKPLPPGWDRLPRFIGFIDVKKPDLGIIEDHKSAKNRRYTLTPDKLKRDVQLLSYAAVLFAERPALNCITLKHNVALKDTEAPDRVYATTTTVSPDWVAAHWTDVIATIETAQGIRTRVPVLADGSPGGGSALNRADRWAEVPGACDEGDARKKDACEAYGGCPYQDICFLRASALQVTRRLDATGEATPPAAPPGPKRPSLLDRMAPGAPKPASPVPVPYDRPPPPTPAQILDRLIGSDPITAPRRPPTPPIPPTPPTLNTLNTPLQEPNMPFPPKHIITAGADAYVIDPDAPTIQYRVRVIDPKVLDEKGGEVVLVALYPHMDVLPDFDRLPEQYRTTLPGSALRWIPDLNATITSYHPGWLGLKYPKEQVQWYTSGGRLVVNPEDAIPTPEAPAPANMAPATAPAVPQAPVSAHVREIAPGIIQTTTPGPSAPDKNTALFQQHQRALDAAKEVLPPATFAPVRDMLVVVAPTTHKFWSKMVGQVGVVKDISQGESGQSVLTVDIDDQEFEAVVGRFTPYVDTNATAPTSPPVGAVWDTFEGRFEQQADGTAKLITPAHTPAQLPSTQQATDTSAHPLARPIPPPSGVTLTIVQPDQTSATIPASAAPGTEMSNPTGGMTPALLLHFTGMVGKTVRVKPHKGSEFSGVLEAAGSAGITMMSGQVKLAWDAILEVIAWDGTIPGAKPVKLTAEEKKAAKEARAAEDEKAAREQEAKDRAANLPQALGQALQLCKTVLESGKVSKKVMEGLVPLLEQAMEYEQRLQTSLDMADSMGADISKTPMNPAVDAADNRRVNTHAPNVKSAEQAVNMLRDNLDALREIATRAGDSK